MLRKILLEGHFFATAALLLRGSAFADTPSCAWTSSEPTTTYAAGFSVARLGTETVTSQPFGFGGGRTLLVLPSPLVASTLSSLCSLELAGAR